jgi:4-amino-4-deoxy-L-arabinose transferase-like glycosyltransferase
MKKIINTEFLILLAVLVVAVVFRIIRLRTAPDWFMDEGEFLRLVRYISKGNFDFLGIRNSILLIGRPPLFLWILAGAIKIFGTDFIVLRGLAVICSLLTIGICYILTRLAIGKSAAFYAAFLLAILPEYIYYNRIGFSYNWTSLWMLFFVFGLWKYLTLENLRWLLVACLAAGISLASDYIGIICVIVLFLILVFTHPRQLWIMVIVGIPWIISMLPLFAISSVDVWHDLIYTFILGSGTGGNLIVQLIVMLAKYFETIRTQSWILLGILGIFTINENKLRGILLLMLAGIVVILLPSRVLLGHYLLPVWPLIMIGVGSFLAKSTPYVYGFLQLSINNLKIMNQVIVNETLRNTFGSIVSIFIVFVVIFLPITWMIILNLGSFIIEPINPYLALEENPWKEGFIPAADAEAIAKKISPTLNPDDFVIAPGVIAWMLPSNAADARTVVVYEYGGKTLRMGDFDRARFTVNSSVSNAKYAIVDESWRIWLVNMAPEISTMLDEVKKWPLVMESGSLQLFCNPTYCH